MFTLNALRPSLFMMLPLLLFFANLSAQKTEKICGEYTYIAPENVTLEQAKQTALDRAIAEALTNKYGSTVSQSTATVLENKDGKSKTNILSIGGSQTKGEWIETTQEPQYTVSYEQGMQVVKVSVCGKARERTGAGIDFMAKVLKNGTEAKFESEDFRDGDAIYLLFRSPVDGYLAVYLVVDSETASCLLPYVYAPSGNVRIQGGKEYVFFSKKQAKPSEATTVDEYVMTASKSAEQDFLYIIFSPNEFTKANDKIISEALPRELSLTDFQQWLTKNRIRDEDMKVDTKILTVTKQK